MINASSEPQLSEITRLSQKIYALIDSERAQAGANLSPDRQGFAEICSKLKIPCTILERRAIENYFPEHAIQSVKKSSKYRALAPYELLRAVDPSWDKSENWRIARAMSKQDLKGTDLERFLEQI